MTDPHAFNRRHLLASLGGAALAFGAGQASRADEPLPLALVPVNTPDAKEAEVADKQLARARKYGAEYALIGRHTVSQPGEARGSLFLTSALGVDGEPERYSSKTGKVIYFRADATRDEFTKSGGWYYQIGKSGEEQQASFGDQKSQGIFLGNRAGAGSLIMAVYQLDGVIHWYELSMDLRC